MKCQRLSLFLVSLSILAFCSGCPVTPQSVKIFFGEKAFVLGIDGQNYESRRSPWSLYYSNEFPLAVVEPTTYEEISRAVVFGRTNNISVLPRSGGHSYQGLSACNGCIILSLEKLRAVTLKGANTSTPVFVVQGGARNNEIVQTISQTGYWAPHGLYATVGYISLTTGGGYTTNRRRLGLNVDKVVSYVVVLADGRIVETSKYKYPDLFWALRGGGKVNFGIVAEMTIEVERFPPVVTFGLLTFPNTEEFKDMFLTYQQLTTNNSQNRQGTFYYFFSGSVGALSGLWFGNYLSFNSSYGAILNRPGIINLFNEVNSTNYYDVYLSLFGYNPNGTIISRNFYLSSNINTSQVSKIVELTTSSPQISGSLFSTFVCLYDVNGAVSDVSSTATAFFHRSERFLVEVVAMGFSVNNSTDAGNWVRDTYHNVTSFRNGAITKYVNYEDLEDNPNWQSAYYGSNFYPLRLIKSFYDPTNFFKFAQSIPPLF